MIQPVENLYPTHRETELMSQLQNINETGLALQGYDPISYWESQPCQGNPDISSTYAGAIYQFSDEANKAKFDASPQQYIPQYGGFCAVAISEGKTFPIDPNTYIISDNKLYLFYNGNLGNTKPQWEENPNSRQASADSHWQKHDIAVVYPTMQY